jgi:plastocyanin
MNHKQHLIWIAIVWIGAAELHAQMTPRLTSQASTQQPDTQIQNAATTATVRGRVQVADTTTAKTSKKRREPIPGTVVWLTPLTSVDEDPVSALPRSPASFRLVQKNKSFEPHILVVPAGSQVEFPNHDPFFHNVFSLFEGKRFDLGLYEAGTSRMVRFDRPGISYIFCNIHPEMSAVVITLTTPLYAISNADGQLSLPGVPFGRYVLHIWSEGMGPENAQPLTREITIAENASSLGVIRVPEADGQRMAHKNKYGRDYDDPAPNNSVYNH